MPVGNTFDGYFRAMNDHVEDEYFRAPINAIMIDYRIKSEKARGTIHLILAPLRGKALSRMRSERRGNLLSLTTLKGLLRPRTLFSLLV